MDKLLERIGEDFLHWVLWVFFFIMLHYVVRYALGFFGLDINPIIDIFLAFIAFVGACYVEILNEGKIKPIGKPGDTRDEDRKITLEIKK